MNEVDLDYDMHRMDPDRWLSSRFVADVQARADLIKLYAFEAELMAIPTRVSQPMLAEMRYRWWADQMDGVFAGEPRKGHPVLEAMMDIVRRHGLDRGPFDALIEAHIGRVHGEPHDLEAFYVGPMEVAVRLLAGPGHYGKVEKAAQVWGYAQVGKLDEARSAIGAANAALKGLPSSAFPAVAHATLIKPSDAEPVKKLRLTWAMLRGRL